MYNDSRYDDNYRKNVYWISATTSTLNTKIAQTISYDLTFFGAKDLNIGSSRQIHFQQTIANPMTSKIDINIILYAYDNNPTPIKQ